MESPSYPKTAMAEVQKYDPALFIKWNRIKNRWELWRRSRFKNHYIMTIVNRDGSYRPVDNRLSSYLVNTDLWRMGKDATTIHRDMLYYEQKQKEKEEQKLYDTFLDISKRPYVKRAFQEQYT